jgi:hypothetical protein
MQEEPALALEPEVREDEVFESIMSHMARFILIQRTELQYQKFQASKSRGSSRQSASSGRKIIKKLGSTNILERDRLSTSVAKVEHLSTIVPKFSSYIKKQEAMLKGPFKSGTGEIRIEVFDDLISGY